MGEFTVSTLSEEACFSICVAAGAFVSAGGLLHQAVHDGELTIADVDAVRMQIDKASELMLARHGEQVPQATKLVLEAIMSLLSFVEAAPKPEQQPPKKPNGKETLQ